MLFFMLGCCSIVSCCMLSSIVLLIADLHPIPVIFILISTEIISSFQRHTWFAKLMPCSCFSSQSTHMHCISHLACHDMYCTMLFVHCTVIYCGSLLVFLLWVERETSTCTRNLLSTLMRIKLSTTQRILQARLAYPRYQFYLWLLDALSFAMPMLRYLPLAISCLPYCHFKPLTILS